MVTIRRTSSAVESAFAFSNELGTIASFSLPSASGNERMAMERVAEVARDLGFEGDALERLKTAVSEATMNAIEHGNKGDPELLVEIEVKANLETLLVRIVDQGGDSPMPDRVMPNLEAKLGGRAEPKGLGTVPDRKDGRCHADHRGERMPCGRTGNETRRKLMPGSPFAAHVRHEASGAVIDLEGDIDRTANTALDAAYDEAISTQAAGAPVILNFQKVDYINSTGIAVIVTILARARSDGRPLRAWGSDRPLREIFQITRLSDFMSIYESEPQALATN